MSRCENSGPLSCVRCVQFVRRTGWAWLLLAGACASPVAPGAAPAGSPASDAGPQSPWDTLGGAEIARAVAILREAGKAGDDSRYPEFDIVEPPKAEALAWRAGADFSRKARVVVLDRSACESHEAVVDLRAGRVESWNRIAGGQPMILMEEYTAAADAVRADPRWIDAMKRRGIDDVAHVYLDVWAPGHVPVPGAGKARVARVISFDRGDAKSPYGPPIEGVVAAVDLCSGKVLEVVDSGVRPRPDVKTDVYDAAVTGTRAALRPLVTTLPEGPGFDASGNEVRWDRWRFRWSFHQREGLVLHRVAWTDGERERPILHRGSFAEMLVPYADPDANWSWRSAFDEGEYGLGRLANPLVAGASVPGHATLFDVTLPDDEGKPATIPGAVALWERDAGFLWTHFDAEHGTAARRARELVVAFIATIGNYDYSCEWVLTQDGEIRFETVLTGSLLTKAVESVKCGTCDPATANCPEAVEQRYGTLVAPHILAPNHQHFLGLRLDLDVDGVANSVKEVTVRGEGPGPHNPRGNAFRATSTPLARESAARRDANPAEHRVWEIVNTSSRNAQGHPAAYALVPGPASKPYLLPETTLRRCAAFAEHPFQVTRHHDGELFPAGSYPGQNHTPAGLIDWTRDDESIDGEDVVVWATIGVTHVPRPEEFPIMNATRVGLKLVPVGFFDRNPGIDVPATPRRE